MALKKGSKMIEQLEKDLANIAKAIDQSAANHNVLMGQKIALEHVIAKMKEAVVKVETVSEAVEQVVDTSPASNN
jgi:hypothetical protein